ncbi:RNA polymerase II elongation factor ELL2-like [Zonotrichia albicollis]|uniref:RNA polymerase II elongation factor ELL2-like n=1 Tax=Zonotrichia albicollis TaxID=44394 RepID=UPI003D812075
MAELRAWAGSSEFRRAPIRTASHRVPTGTAMSVRVSQRCQEQELFCVLPTSHLTLLFLLSFPLGKQADVRRAKSHTSCPAPEEKRTKPTKPAENEQKPCSAVYRRPYRDRVIHLLALRTYKKPELLARLQRDGVMQKDKGTLAKILQQVAKWNAKDNCFSLKEHLFQTLQTDWPGYTEIDRQKLKLILSRNGLWLLTQTEKFRSSSIPKTAREQKEIPNSSGEKNELGRLKQWHRLDFDEDLLMTDVKILLLCRSKKRDFHYLHMLCNKRPTRLLEHMSLKVETVSPRASDSKLGCLCLALPCAWCNITHVFFGLETYWNVLLEFTHRKMVSFFPIRKYVAIVSLEQRQRYKDDFNAEYEEYRNLHSVIDRTTKKFRQFQEQWKSLTPGSEAYQRLHHQILADYQQLQQGSPSYSEMKSRCQYLHKKLAHIQRRISEYDQQ